mmetsp:Transcript_39884/g.78643  ORF Transcript_39884/g.78643 Transcript_39884/m.78643 type:complete len:81 (-) Transcript_39884:148-390(-)
MGSASRFALVFLGVLLKDKRGQKTKIQQRFTVYSGFVSVFFSKDRRENKTRILQRFTVCSGFVVILLQVKGEGRFNSKGS